MTNESDAASSTTGAGATTAINKEDSTCTRTPEDNNTASTSLVLPTSDVVTPSTPPASTVQLPPVGVCQAHLDSAACDLGTLVDGPAQSILGSYLRNKMDHCFRAVWYTSYQWLEYSMAKHKAFCFTCRNFSTSTSKSKKAFTKDGFAAWSKAIENNCVFKSP